MKIAGMVVVAVMAGWLARGIRFEDPPKPATLVTPPVVEQRPEPVAEAPSVISRIADHEVSLGERNLFAYRIHETPAVLMAAPPSEPVIETPPAVVIAEPPAPQPIPFPYRYIGTFGPAHNRVAAFKRDGDIITARTGDRLGDFLLKSIGIESAEVEGPDGTRRIPLSSDV